MATASPAEQQEIPTPVSSASVGTEREGWAYLGHYVASTKKWKTTYFDFSLDVEPSTLAGKTLKVREQTGALNVRAGMPTLMGQFQKVIDVLKPGSEGTIHDIKEWHSTGYIWAKITYGT